MIKGTHVDLSWVLQKFPINEDLSPWDSGVAYNFFPTLKIQDSL